MKNKKLYLVIGLILLGFGVTGCQSNTSISATSSSTSHSSKSKLPSLNNDSNSSQDTESSNQESSTMSQNSESSSIQKNSENKSEDSAQVSKTNLPGDEGLYPIPVQYQGTWYSYVEGKEEKITFTGSKIITDSTPTELHKVDTDKLPTTPTQNQIEAGEHYGRISSVIINGIKYLNIKGYFQVNGFGTYYGYHTEKGHPVIVLSFGGNASGSNSVYWKSPELAKQYKDEKFNDLHYVESGD